MPRPRHIFFFLLSVSEEERMKRMKIRLQTTAEEEKLQKNAEHRDMINDWYRCFDEMIEIDSSQTTEEIIQIIRRKIGK
jgi:thymidylate kinase